MSMQRSVVEVNQQPSIAEHGGAHRMCAGLGAHRPADARYARSVRDSRVRSKAILEVSAIRSCDPPENLNAICAVPVLVGDERLQVITKGHRHSVALVAAAMRVIVSRGARFALQIEGKVLICFDNMCND